MTYLETKFGTRHLGKTNQEVNEVSKPYHNLIVYLDALFRKDNTNVIP